MVVVLGGLYPTIIPLVIMTNGMITTAKSYEATSSVYCISILKVKDFFRSMDPSCGNPFSGGRGGAGAH